MKRVLAVLFVVLASLALPAAPASAHAALVNAAPEPGSVVTTAPAEIVVRFSENISVVAGRTQVLAPDGKRITGSVTADGPLLRIGVRHADHPLGTYLVSYRIISADSHPVGGAMTFSVGAPSARPAEGDPTAIHPSVRVAVPALRFLGYAGLVLAVGPALLLAVLWPRRLSRRGPILLTRAGLVATAAATLGALWAQAPAASGAPLWDVSVIELADVLAAPFGLTLLARLAVLAAVAVLLPPVLRGERSRWRPAIVLVLAAGGLATWPLTGHARESPLPAAIVAADVVHLAAMAAWLGGLVTLSVFLLRRAHPRVLGRILPAWSRWAALAVVWLTGAGVVQAVVQVGSVGALTSTTYGKLVLAKAGVLAAVLGLAALARRFVLGARVLGDGPGALRRTVGLEVAGTVVVLGLSAVLVQTTPGRAVTAERNAPAVKGVSGTLTAGLFTLQYNVYPVELGENNTVHGFTYTPEGKPLTAQEWTVTTRLRGQDLEPVSQPMLPLTPRNDAVGALTFPLPGTYDITFTVRTTEIDQATVRTTITVPQVPGAP
ncbi:copper resistance protein CopC [Actinoplanes sp. N902-109]|uniref:copper resistance CopC/CopD family protein n=1 Tax=Actinoplanes sp. (strain N902-109) TaxID=649831 RepID=UPI00032950C7|nr:copper resistance protein CopC [Actinoplanes sp. N902-109]AGL17333.1 copper resistance protein CopC [Actinoplanes sp. N902-109]